MILAPHDFDSGRLRTALDNFGLLQRIPKTLNSEFSGVSVLNFTELNRRPVRTRCLSYPELESFGVILNQIQTGIEVTQNRSVSGHLISFSFFLMFCFLPLVLCMYFVNKSDDLNSWWLRLQLQTVMAPGDFDSGRLWLQTTPDNSGRLQLRIFRSYSYDFFGIELESTPDFTHFTHH